MRMKKIFLRENCSWWRWTWSGVCIQLNEGTTSYKHKVGWLCLGILVLATCFDSENSNFAWQNTNKKITNIKLLWLFFCIFFSEICRLTAEKFAASFPIPWKDSDVVGFEFKMMILLRNWCSPGLRCQLQQVIWKYHKLAFIFFLCYNVWFRQVLEAHQKNAYYWTTLKQHILLKHQPGEQSKWHCANGCFLASSCDVHTFAFSTGNENVSFSFLLKKQFLCFSRVDKWKSELALRIHLEVAHEKKKNYFGKAFDTNQKLLRGGIGQSNYRWNSKHCRRLLKEVKSCNTEIIYPFFFCHTDCAPWITCPVLYTLTLLSSSLEFQSLHFSLHLVPILSPLLLLL